MIIVVLLFFQSFCLYLQNIVLTVHDKWLNPKHARLYIDKEQQRLQLLALKPKHPVPGCSFCSNSPLGYCRHHNPNQPTLRHLKNRLIARGGKSAIGGTGGAGETQVSGSSTSLSTTEKANSVVGYFGDRNRQNPDKVCTCLSCTHGASRNASSSSGRRNRTSWGTRSGNAYCGGRLLTTNNNGQALRICYNNESRIVATGRRARLNEKLHQA